ncbi:MAG: tetratricopeptide repeat protein [Paludibacteraceae bacterium]|nr:tetratricopeptide repeat protein [Paludibacteraceae bacterium]
MAKQNFKKEDEQLENVNEALSTTGQWIEDHSNLLTWIVTIIVIVILAIMALNSYVIKPKAVEASNENAKAVVYFQNGDFEKALNGDDAECIGFEQIANDYKLFQQGKLAALYAGVCYYNLGDNDQAAHYLNRFSAKDVNVDPAAKQLLGDVYVELEDYSRAAKAFEAAAKSGNKLIAPMSLRKAGLVYLELGNKKAALRVFEAIKAEYPMSQEASDIDKYIELAR